MSQTPKEFPAGLASHGPDLPTKRRDESTNGDLHTTITQEVPREHAAPALTFGLVRNEVRYLNSTRSKLIQTLADAFTARDTDIVNPEEFVCDTKVTEQKVPSSTEPDAATFLQLSSEVKDLDGVHALKRTVTTSEYHALESKSLHPELDLPLSIIRELVPHGTELPAEASDAGTMITIQEIDCVKALKTTTTITGWDTYDEDFCEEIEFMFPSYLNPAGHFSTSSGFLPNKRRSTFSIQANRRHAFRKLVEARVNVTLFDSKPASATRYSIIPNNLVYNGMLFNLNEQAVLTNAGTITATTNSRDVYYGFGSESVSYGASTPSASDYVAAIGTEKLVGERITKWQFNLWRREQVYVTME